MANELHIDFETRSTIDLKKVGLYNYAAHPDTDIWVCCYSFDDDPVRVWRPNNGSCPMDIYTHICHNRTVIAHNVAFEMAIINNIGFKKYNWPKIKIEQAHCTMAMAYAMALPGSLEKAAAAMGIDQQKDMAGNRLMLQMSRPRGVDADTGEIIWWDDLDKKEKLINYCAQDVKVEKELFKRLLRLSPNERKVWELDYKINKRGVSVDIESVHKAIEVIEFEKQRLDKDMATLSRNQIASCRAVADIVRYLKVNGIETKSIDKSNLNALLERDDVPENCKKILRLRKEAAKSSTAKLVAMRDSICSDNTLKGIFQYCGAGTGRWAGRKVQFHNLPRPTISQDSIEYIFKVLNSGDSVSNKALLLNILFDSTTDAISSCLRGFIISKQKVSAATVDTDLIGCDFSAIEARVLAWLAREENILNTFRGDGKVYEHTASNIFNVVLSKITKDQRQIGKVAVLALGYQGGVRAFQSMAKNYNVKISDKDADAIKSAWRVSNQNIVRYWYKIESLFLTACRNPGKIFEHFNIQVKVDGSFLWCKLPSGRALCYPYPKIQQVKTPWGEMKEAVTYKGINPIHKKWVRKIGYGGLFVENITQATARDLMAEAMLRLDTAGFDIVMHVHDEIVGQVPKDIYGLTNVESIMSEVPDWATGLPIAAEGFRGKRYRK